MTHTITQTHNDVHNKKHAITRTLTINDKHNETLKHNYTHKMINTKWPTHNDRHTMTHTNTHNGKHAHTKFCVIFSCDFVNTIMYFGDCEALRRVEFVTIFCTHCRLLI